MDTTNQMRNWLAGALLLTAAFVSGAALHQQAEVQADVRRATPREAFKSGGARSEVVLREIHTTLKRIDARLERMERAVLAATKAQN